MQLGWAALELELAWVEVGVDGVGEELELDYTLVFNEVLKASSARSVSCFKCSKAHTKPTRKKHCIKKYLCQRVRTNRKAMARQQEASTIINETSLRA